MKNKKIGLLSVILVIAVIGIVAYFILRPPLQQELIPQEFAQLPEKPKLIAEFNHSATIKTDGFTHEGLRLDTAKPIYSVSFSPIDPSLIASVNGNGTIKLWNINNTKEPIRILQQTEIFPFISFSPSGKLLACAGYETLTMWDVDSGKEIKSPKTVRRQIAFTPDGNQLVTVYNGVKLWDIRNPKRITQIATLPFDEAYKTKGGACAIDISPDGKWIAVGYSNGTIHVWDLHTQQLVTSLETSLFQMDFLKFSPNNKYMVTGGNTLEMYSSRPKGYIMWDIPSWKRRGEVIRGHVENLVFSPDGNMCVSANDYSGYGRGVELWSTVDGAPITSLQTEAKTVSFSQDGKLLATGDRDGIVRLWELTHTQLDLANDKNDAVRLIYYLPKDKDPSPNITQKIDNTIRRVQKHYADEMERHGFGRKTFTFETDENGKAKIYRMYENQFSTHDFQLNDIWIIFVDEHTDLQSGTNNLLKLYKSVPYTNRFRLFEISFIYPTKKNKINDKISMRDIKGVIGKGRLVRAKKKDFNWKLTAYSLKHLFSTLAPDHRWYKYEPNVLKRFIFGINRRIPWGKDLITLSRCEAEWLDKSRFFNPNQSFFDKRPEIEMNILKADTDSPLLQFTATDDDGIHQLLLFLPEDIERAYEINKLEGCRVLNGKKTAIVEFEISDSKITEGEIRMIDMHGNIASREFRFWEETSEPSKEQ